MPNLNEYVSEAYTQAIETLLWSEIGGCRRDCDMWNRRDRFGEFTCDRNYDTHGWYPTRVKKSKWLLKLLEGLAMEFWPELCESEITPSDFGHNFIMSTNGHGCGFWSRDYGKLGNDLDDMCVAEVRLESYKGWLEIQ